MENNPGPKSLFSFLRGRAALILTGLLLSQAAIFYGFSRGEKTPETRPLNQFPKEFGPWRMSQEGVMEQEVKDILRADDYINRFYVNPDTKQMANLFVAFFKTQRYGQQPHSPKNCLPGSGWIWTVSDTIPIAIAGRAEPIRVNRYVVQKGDQKSLVLYWYQSRSRVVASDYVAKVFVVADALRYNRTDTSLVRVWIPVAGDEQASTAAAVSFAQAFFDPLSEYLPK